METLDSAQDYVSEKLIGSLVRELIKPRSTDACPLVRKCVIEQVASFEPNEIRTLCEQKDFKLVALLFQKLNDTELSKTALNAIWQLVSKAQN